MASGDRVSLNPGPVDEHVMQETVLERQHDGMVPIAHLVMSTDPPVYDSDANAAFAAEQVE
jgi:hypothetical protein